MKGYNTRLVWIISAEIRYLLSEQKKFQNKSKNIGEVYQSEFFRCMWCYLNNTYQKMELSYYNSIFQ